MPTLSVPEADAVDLLGELPPDTEVVVWDGSGAPPPGAEGLEMFVPPYNLGTPDPGPLAGLSGLRVIQLLSAGVEPWLPVVPDGVQLCNGRGIHGASTAELAFAGMLAVLRDLPAYAHAQQQHQWQRRVSGDLDGRRVLVVGAGDIGGRIADAARVFGAEVTVVGRTARDGVRATADLPRLVPEHDVVALAVPHTADTDRLVDARFLASMPDGAMLVNVARGSVVDTAALVAELQSGRLRAFLDVTDPEPLPADHPLWDVPNLLLTPHVGGGTDGWKRRGYRLVGEQFRRLVAGEQLLNTVSGGY